MSHSRNTKPSFDTFGRGLPGRPGSGGRLPTSSHGGWPAKEKGSNKTFKGRLMGRIDMTPTQSRLIPKPWIQPKWKDIHFVQSRNKVKKKKIKFWKNQKETLHIYPFHPHRKFLSDFLRWSLGYRACGIPLLLGSLF